MQQDSPSKAMRWLCLGSILNEDSPGTKLDGQIHVIVIEQLSRRLMACPEMITIRRKQDDSYYMFINGGKKTVLVHSPNANSEERSQTQIKGSAFGFLEDGRELNYNPHLTNRKK